MLQLRPCCEHCKRALPPNSTDAMICSYECTFCRECVDRVLLNVCPNCGGGFCRRPIRPATEYRGGVSLTHHPATERTVHSPVNRKDHGAFAAAIKTIAPEKR